ncbi:hypothetical protein F5148DRAFT_152312 [Russula earlei]|uniref:Uncharacterized protein n=1 Tax=Russula earlei TaxID=71964 RepID=A0ACC0U8E5_9AGAM|nr:hypothetical protein F5148DRAFT_152312 [Russula earlei]
MWLSQASWKGKYRACRQNRVTIHTLPDDVLVEIFHFYVNDWRTGSNGWHTLVHACRTWRCIVFASPRYLNLQLKYTGKRPISEMLDIWPVLPVVISLTTYPSSESYPDRCWGNIAVALESEHHHRICVIDLSVIPASHWERMAAAMQKPFPELTLVRVWLEENTVTPLPDSFLGGSAPLLLRHLSLRNCPFPGMPKLLLSANHLVHLFLRNIPYSGYISPQALVTALSVMSRIETLYVEFRSPRSRPDPESRPPPPPTRSVLSALTDLEFQGAHEYLEDLLAQIEAPLLNKLEITFFMVPNFVVPQLRQFISLAESFKTCDKAFVETSYCAIRIAIFRERDRPSPKLSLNIRCRELDWQLSSLAQVCSSSFPLLSTLVQLDILHVLLPDAPSHRRNGMERTQWLELLHPFTAVKHLRLSDQVAPRVCQALEELSEERRTEVLPALQNIFLSDLSVPKFIERFVAARQLAGHPVAVYPWENHEIFS